MLLGSESIRVLSADVNSGAAVPMEKSADVRLAASSSADRLVVENHLLIELSAGHGNEKPFALSYEYLGSATISLVAFALLAALKIANQIGLEGFFGGHDAADRSRFGNTGDEPMAFIVTAEELVLGVRQAGTFGGLPHHQEQVTVLSLHIQNFNISIVLGLNVEEFATPILSNVDHDRPAALLPAISD